MPNLWSWTSPDSSGFSKLWVVEFQEPPSQTKPHEAPCELSKRDVKTMGTNLQEAQSLVPDLFPE